MERICIWSGGDGLSVLVMNLEERLCWWRTEEMNGGALMVEDDGGLWWLRVRKVRKVRDGMWKRKLESEDFVE